MTEKGRPLSETPYGKLPPVTSKNSCKSWERATCLEARLQNEPESLLVEGRTDILRCPVCQHTIELEVPIDE